MKLISGVSVEQFRSIRGTHLESFGDFTAIAGLNNSGKSNLLRALNAFFTGHVEPGQAIDLSRDYHRPDLTKKKAKRIRVSVEFSLPPSFKFRRDLQPVQNLLGGTQFRITREWSRRQEGISYFLNDEPLGLDDQRTIDQFLQLINFRYIPNRVLPIDVIKSEHRALRDALVRRVAKRAKGSKQAFEALSETSRSMIEAMAERVKKLQPDAGGVRLATPTSWSDMIFAFGYLLEQGGTELEDVLQGSGVQSILMLETLYLIDQDYFQKFGWRQAAVWGIEEPESSLHTSLEVQIAEFLRSVSSAANSRLQVLSTTHSDLMIQYSDESLFAESSDVGTIFTSGQGKRAVLEKAARAGVSRWVHPILHYPLDPLVLVEGPFDRVFIQEALRSLRLRRVPRVADLTELSDGDSGGVERLRSYVKQNKDVIRSRAVDSPVVVVLDWDSAGKAEGFRQLFDESDPFEVLTWQVEEANPELGKSFHGIERFYPTRMIDAAENKGFPIARTLPTAHAP